MPQLFGIFGPTGAGKSTVLDAITLALFGQVNRAPRQTQGIINSREKRCWVRFVFSLSGHSYTAERLFERVKDMRSRHCWIFTCDLAMRDWKKNEAIAASLSVDKEGKDTLDARSFTGVVNVGRRNIYIVLTGLALVLSLICLAIVMHISRRIRHVEEGKLDYSNTTVRTIDRHR